MRSSRPLAIRCEAAPTSVEIVVTKITVGINSAIARVTRASCADADKLRNIGMATAARPDVDGIKNVRGSSAVVINQKSCPILRARLATTRVKRVARPVL